jgi:hypothetical protein
MPVTGTPDRSCPQQPHAAGPHSTVSSGLSDCFSVLDCVPGCLPGLRPDLPRSDLSFGFFLYGLSEDGGLDDVEDSPNFRWRFPAEPGTGKHAELPAQNGVARCRERRRVTG